MLVDPADHGWNEISMDFARRTMDDFHMCPERTHRPKLLDSKGI